MKKKQNSNKIILKNLNSKGWANYELLDSGNRKKLERFGSHTLIRFEPEAIWKPGLNLNIWKSANAEYTIYKEKRSGSWNIQADTPQKWLIQIDDISVMLNISQSRHIGIFPEQIENWRWIQEKAEKARREIHILNLFAYTGISTLFAARTGAHITHVDASRKAIEMGKESSRKSGLSHMPIRWIVDDAFKFAKRDIRRRKKYDAIILDPPAFGKGPKGEIWKLENDLPMLLHTCKELLSDHPLFIILTAYNIPQSPIDLAELLSTTMSEYTGIIEFGNLIQQEKSAGRKIHQAKFARWSSIN